MIVKSGRTSVKWRPVQFSDKTEPVCVSVEFYRRTRARPMTHIITRNIPHMSKASVDSSLNSNQTRFSYGSKQTRRLGNNPTLQPLLKEKTS